MTAGGHGDHAVFADAVGGGREASLVFMRDAMLAREGPVAAVCIGDMEFVEAELSCSRAWMTFRRFRSVRCV